MNQVERILATVERFEGDTLAAAAELGLHKATVDYAVEHRS